MPASDEQKRKIAAALIGAGVQKQDAAKAIGVHVNTITNWCKEEAFQAACNKAAQAVMDAVVTAGQAATSLALAKIIELAGCKEKAIALRAAQDILDRFGLPKGLTQTIVQEGALPIIVYEAIDAIACRDQKKALTEPDRASE